MLLNVVKYNNKSRRAIFFVTGAATTDRVIKSNSLSLKGAFSNIKEARGAVQYENVFLGWHACAARTSPSRWRAPLARSAPADSSSRRHCRGTGTRCLGPRCPHCAPRLPGPQDPDRGDGPLLARFLCLKPRTRALRVPRSPVPTALAGLSWCR